MLFIIEVILCDGRVLGGYADELMVLQQLPGRFRTAHTHAAFAQF